MFLPVLLGGILWVGLRWFFKARLWGHRLYRMLSFFYHSAIVVLINGLLVNGILEIAETESDYVIIFWALSGVLAILAIMIFVLITKSRKFRMKL